MNVFLAGKFRFAVEHANFLLHQTVHNPPAGTSYGVDQLDHSLESVQSDDEHAMSIVVERTGQPLKTVRRWFSRQQLRSTEFAQKHGIIDSVKPVSFPAQSNFFQVIL
jgi:ATP-dependent protease ClpP protease subunit